MSLCYGGPVRRCLNQNRVLKKEFIKRAKTIAPRPFDLMVAGHSLAWGGEFGPGFFRGRHVATPGPLSSGSECQSSFSSLASVKYSSVVSVHLMYAGVLALIAAARARDGDVLAARVGVFAQAHEGGKKLFFHLRFSSQPSRDVKNSFKECH
jgi:hypothetical protein